MKATLRASLPPRGKLPKATEASLERNALWLYKHKVCGQSIRRIAKDAFGPEGDQRRKDVRDGINNAFKLLSLTRHEFIELPNSNLPVIKDNKT